jgi:hypothetical protein
MEITNLTKGAFGDLMVAQETPIFQGSFEYTVGNTKLNTNTVTNSGTITQATAMAVIGTGTTTDSKAYFQTKRHAKYKTGFGGKAKFTALFTSPVAGTSQLIGLADELGSTSDFKNGFMIGYIGTVFGYHRFQNDAVTTTALADWDDPLDGTGPSGVTIDKTKLNVFYIQFKYLGAGAQYVYMEVGNGEIAKVATIPYSNSNITPSIYMPNLKLFMYTNNKATTSNIILKSASYGYFVEGKTEFGEIHQPQFSKSVTKTGVTTQTNLITFKNKSTYNSITNYIDCFLERVMCSIEASSPNNLALLRVIRNTTLGGVPSYTDISATDSVVSYDTAGTTITGGDVLLTIPLAGKNDKATENIYPFRIIMAPNDTITISGESVNSATIIAELLWKEAF